MSSDLVPATVTRDSVNRYIINCAKLYFCSVYLTDSGALAKILVAVGSVVIFTILHGIENHAQNDRNDTKNKAVHS